MRRWVVVIMLVLLAPFAWSEYAVSFKVSYSGYITIYISGIPQGHKVLVHWGLEPYPQGPWTYINDTPMVWSGSNYTATIGPFKNDTWVAFVFYDATAGIWINYKGTPFWNWNIKVNPTNIGYTKYIILPNCSIFITIVGRAPDEMVLRYGLAAGPQPNLPLSNVTDVALEYDPLWGNYTAVIGPFRPGQWVQWTYYDKTLNRWIYAPGGVNFAAQATCMPLEYIPSYPYDRFVYVEGETAHISANVRSNTGNITADFKLIIGPYSYARDGVRLSPGLNSINFTVPVEMPQGIYEARLLATSSGAVLLNATLPQFYVLNTTGKPPISLVIIWNMHQPLYIEPNGSWAMPWVSLHTGEDFKWNGALVGAYELQAMLLNEFPLNVSVDFTPVLLYQWEALLAEGPGGFRYIGYYPGNITHDIEAVNKTLALYERLVDEGRLEVLTVPFYHPLEAIIYGNGWQSDLLAQLNMGEAMVERIFGVDASCAWTPEMAFNMGLVHLYYEAGINCTVLDAQAFLPYATFINGSATPYVPYVVQDSVGHRIYVLFRDTDLSNLFSFYLFTLTDQRLAQQLLIQYLAKVYMKKPGAVVVVALDGENPIIFNSFTGPRDLHAIYKAIYEYSGKWLVTQTVSQAIASHAKYAVTNLPESSWALNLNNWNNGYPGKTEIWRAVGVAREWLVALTYALGARPSPVLTLDPARAPNSTDELHTLWNYLYIAEGSDWTWQTGPPNYGPEWFSKQPLIYTNKIMDIIKYLLNKIQLVSSYKYKNNLYINITNNFAQLRIALSAGAGCVYVELKPGSNIVALNASSNEVEAYLPVTPDQVPGYVEPPSPCGMKFAEWKIAPVQAVPPSASQSSAPLQPLLVLASVLALAALVLLALLRRGRRHRP